MYHKKPPKSTQILTENKQLFQIGAIGVMWIWDTKLTNKSQTTIAIYELSILPALTVELLNNAYSQFKSLS